MQLKSLIDDFLAWMKVRVNQGANRPGTLDYYTYNLRKAQGYVGKKTEVDAISPFTLAMWCTTWHRWQSLTRLFNWALKLRLVASSPARDLEKPARGERKRILNPTEGARCLRRSAADFRLFLLGMRETMARPQEVREFDWKDLHTSTNGHLFFALDEFKARRRRKDKDAVRIIPVTARLARALARIAAKRGREGVIFRTKRGKAWTKETLRGRMRTLRRRLKITPDKRGENVVCYTWRHTSATKNCTKGLRDKMLAELMGHTSTRTTNRYQHPQTDDLLNAFHSINDNAHKAQDLSEDLVKQLRAILAQLEKPRP